MPFTRNKNFVGRSSQLEQLTLKIRAEGQSHRIAIQGLGGVGKTEIALEVAYRIKDLPGYTVFWVPASDSSAFEHAYLNIGQALEIPGINDKKANVKQLVRDELSRDTSGKWLMVVDNADDINLFLKGDENGSIPLDEYLPQSSQGSTLFTTRSLAAAVELVGDQAGDDVVSVEQMNRNDARSLLKSYLLRKHLVEDEEATVELLDNLLVCLPLAIAQAAAYMNKRDMSISRYIALFKESEDSMISILSEGLQNRRSTKNPVSTTWLISFNQIKRDDPLAADYLSFMSCIGRQDIPVSILPPRQTIEKENALGTLKAYSFITLRTTLRDGSDSYDVHQLVHLATRNMLRTDTEKGDQLTTWSEKTLIQLAETFPKGTHENKAKWTSYMPHARCILASPHLPKRSEKHQWVLLFNVAWCLRSSGDYDAAATMARRDLELRETALGLQHPDTLSSVNNMAVVLDHQGKYEHAEQMSRRALNGRETVLGMEHPDTLTSASHLALILWSQGSYDEAEKVNRRALEGRERLGSLLEDTLTSVNNLAGVLTSRARYREAEELNRRALDGRQRVLGPLHPDTLTSIEDLAWVLERQGNYDIAESLNRQAWEGRKQALGPQHPDTLTSMSKLALVLQSQGKYKAVEEMNRQVLQDRERVLGPQHPDTLTSVCNLAAVLYYQAKYEEAEKMYRRALKSVKATLGSRYPLKSRIASDLAGLLQVQCKWKEAEMMNREVFAQYKENLGLEHPYTLTSMSNLAEILQEQDKFEEAEDLHRQALKGRKVLGLEHPHTLASISNLAALLVRQKKYDEAEVMHRRALDGYEKKLGPEHVDTLTSVYHVAHLLHTRKQYNDAIGFYEKACAGYEKQLGHQHRTTQSCAHNYAKMLQEMDEGSRKGRDTRGRAVGGKGYSAALVAWRAAFGNSMGENKPTISNIDWSVD